MDRKKTGLIVILFGMIFLALTYFAHSKIVFLNAELHKTCNLPNAICPLLQPPAETVASFIFSFILLGFGAYLLFYKKPEFRAAEERKEKAKEVVKTLKDEEKTVYNLISDAGGVIFQSELVEKSEFAKVKVTRILDSLEAKGLIERKRRGMTNAVVLK